MFHKCVPDGDLNESFVQDIWANVDWLSEAKEDVILTSLVSNSWIAMARARSRP